MNNNSYNENDMYLDSETGLWGVGEYEPDFSMSEALMVREIEEAFPGCTWGFTEKLMQLCGWNQDTKIANFVPASVLTEIPQNLLPPTNLEA